MKESNGSCSSSSCQDGNATSITLDDSYSDQKDDHDDHSFKAPKTLRRRYQFQPNTNPPSISNAKDNQESLHAKSHPQQQNPFLLFICASGICTSFLYYGIIQERLFSKNSKSAMKSCGNTTTFMLLLSCMTNVFVSTLWIWTENKLSIRSLPISSSSKAEVQAQAQAQVQVQVQVQVNKDKNQSGLNHKLFLRCKYLICCFYDD